MVPLVGGVPSHYAHRHVCSLHQVEQRHTPGTLLCWYPGLHSSLYSGDVPNDRQLPSLLWGKISSSNGSSGWRGSIAYARRHVCSLHQVEQRHTSGTLLCWYPGLHSSLYSGDVPKDLDSLPQHVSSIKESRARARISSPIVGSVSGALTRTVFR